MMANGNGEGRKMAAAWVSIAVAILLGLAGFFRDTPTRAEMEQKDSILESRVSVQIQDTNVRLSSQLKETNARLARIEQLLLENRGRTIR